MALLNDEGPSNFEDWVGYDSKLLFLSEQESTSIEAKAEYAKQHIVSELFLFILNNGDVALQQVEPLLGRIVVTEPLKRWHAMHTLFLYYDDIASVQASKPQHERALQYSKRADEARKMLFEIGLGVVTKAIPQATVPELNTESSNAPAFSLRAKTQYVDGEGYVGAASKEFWIRSENGESIQIGYIQLPEIVAGWNLYIEDYAKQFRLVNSSLLSPSESYQISSSEGNLGQSLNESGQRPDHFIRVNRMLRA